jgi:hypothetical protein
MTTANPNVVLSVHVPYQSGKRSFILYRFFIILNQVSCLLSLVSFHYYSTDGIQNGLEKCTDGGGNCDAKCELSSSCDENSDCTSNLCSQVINKCIDTKCNNGQLDIIMNESSVDCGGNVCESCDINATCNENNDCLTHSCQRGICKAATCNDGMNFFVVNVLCC